MANPDEVMEQAAHDLLMTFAVKWLCAQYGTNGIAKKKADSDLVDVIILALGPRMRRAETTGERLRWVEDLRRAALSSERLPKRVSEVLRKHPWRKSDEK